MNVINKTPAENKIIPVDIDIYVKSEDGKQWLATHVDGLP
jgi:simple sugar transport system substrate-binding protein